MNSIVADVRYALRTFGRQPVFALAAIATLALAIGVNASMFSVVDAVFLQPIQARDPGGLVSVFRTFTGGSGSGAPGAGLLPASYPNYRDFAERTRTVGSLAAETQGPVNLAGAAEPEQVTAGFVTANYFDVLGLEPVVGRFFLPEENRRGAAQQVVVLGEVLWRRRYGGSDDIIGDAIRVHGRDFVVIGVAPAGFRGLFTLNNQALWLPAESWPLIASGPFAGALEHRGFRLFQMIGRRAPGHDREAVEAELSSIATRLAEEHPEWNRERGVRVFSLAEGALNPNQREGFVRAGAIGMGAVGLVLLIACANVANLLVARGRARRRELAIRVSLGAGRQRLGRQLLTEGLLLAFLGGLAGLVVAAWTLPALWRLRPPFLEAGDLDLGLDPRALAFTLVVCIFAGIVFSLAPAMDITRASLVAAVRAGEPAPRGGWRRWGLKHVLVAAQVALAVVLLAGAGLFVESLQAARRIDTGFDAEALAVLSLNTGALGATPEQTAATLERVIEEASATPGVQLAALASGAPLAFAPQLRLQPEGSEEASPDGTYIAVNDVGTGYFDTMGIAILEGRALDRRDRSGGLQVVVVNQSFVQLYWPNGSAIGRQIRWPASDQPWIVVGVAEDIKYATLGELPQPYLYRSLEQFPTPNVTLHLRGGATPGELLAAAVPRIERLVPDLPILDPLPVAAVIERSLWAGSLGATLLAAFGALALALAATGVYGVVAQAAGARRREVGIRMALGAGRGGVVSLIVVQGMTPVLAGAIAGAALCAPLSRLAVGLLYGGAEVSPSIVFGAVAVLAAASLAACAAPALRASRLDPVSTLRAE